MVTMIDSLKRQLSGGINISDDFRNFAQLHKTGQISTDAISNAGGWVKYAQSINNTDRELLKFLGDVDSGRRNIEDIDDYMASASQGTKAFSNALKSAAINMGAMLAVTLAVKATIYILDELYTSFEEQQEIVNDLTTEIEE